MKILVIVSSLECGGAERQSVTAANLLVKSHDVSFVTFRHGPLASLLHPEVHYEVIRKRSYVATAVKLARFCRQRKIAVIHAHLFAAMVAAALSTLLCGAKVFWTFHGHRYESERSGKWTLTVLSRLPWVRRLFFVSHELIEYYRLQGYGFPTTKTRNVYNSIHADATENGHLSGSHIIIGFVGRLIPLKRIDLLLDTARFLLYHGIQHFEVWIAGDGEERDRLEARVRSQGLAQHVHFLGFQHDTGDLYHHMDIFALPSEEEGLSLVLIEAGTFGVPAVAFDVGGNAEVVIDSVTGFIVKTEFAFRERILTLTLDLGLRQTLGERAQRHARANFGPDKHLMELESAFTEVA